MDHEIFRLNHLLFRQFQLYAKEKLTFYKVVPELTSWKFVLNFIDK